MTQLRFSLTFLQKILKTAAVLRGNVSDPGVYGLIGANVSFHDRDAGYSVSQGDYFVIDSQTVGSDSGTWRFQLVDLSTNSVMVDVILPPIEV